MKLINNKVYFAVQDYLMILLGTLLYGFGFNAFILSNEIITGGVSGICALIFFASNELIPVSVSYFVINIVLLLAPLKILGFKFLMVADQTYHWGLLDREVYIAIWVAVFTLQALYLMGKIKFAHDK